MKNKKILDYYLKLHWTYTIETEIHKDKSYYIIRVNELPGVCTHNENLNEGMEEIKEAIACAVELYWERGEIVPEPVDRNKFKGKILYRPGSERHYLLAKAAKAQHQSISNFLDTIVDSRLHELSFI